MRPARPGRASGAAALAAALAGAAWGANQGLTTGAMAATLGSGAACGTERTAFAGNPASLAPGRAGARLDWHRPYGVEALEVAEAGAHWDFARFGTALAWRQTAVADVYLEQGWELRQGWRALTGRPLDFGAAVTVGREAYPGGTRAGASVAAGARWQPLPRLRAGAFAGGIGGEAPVWHFGAEALARGGGAREDGDFPPQAVRLDFRKSGEAPWRVLASLSISPHPIAQITAGLATAPFQAAAGVTLRWSGFEAGQAYRYHRYLGGTFLTGAGWSRYR